MNKEEKELCEAERSLSNELLGVILYLNVNGMHVDRVKQLIDLKVKHAFEKYESENVRERFLSDIRISNDNIDHILSSFNHRDENK